MYKVLKSIFIVLAFGMLTSFSIWYINLSSENLPIGVNHYVVVNNAKLNLTQQLTTIANQNHIIIAKQIWIPKNDGTGENSAFYEKIGTGTLPSLYKEEKDKTVLAHALDTTTYMIIGSGISPEQLAQQLNRQGNSVQDFSVDTRFESVKSLFSLFSTPVFIVLLSFAALLLTEYISKLKSDGIHRLAGVNKLRLAFGGILTDIQFLIFIFTTFSILGILYLFIALHGDIFYFEALTITLSAGFLAFFIIEITLSLIIFYIMQIQPINLSIKGKNPLMLIVIIVITFQAFSILSSMKTIEQLNKANQRLEVLQTSQKAWANYKNYFGTTMLIGSQKNLEQLKNFELELFKNPHVILAASPFGQQGTAELIHGTQVPHQYTPDETNTMDVFYVNPNFLKIAKIKLSASIQNKINHLEAGDYALLIPDSQKKNYSSLVAVWTGLQQNMGMNLTSSPVTALYPSDKDFFGFDTMFTGYSLRSFSDKPIIVVYGAKTFEKSDAGNMQNWMTMWLSNSQFVFNNTNQIETLIHNYHVENSIGSFVNGYYNVTVKAKSAANQRNLLIGVNLLVLLSSLLLISLLNSIYLYQNRREFLVQRLAGKSWLDIHLIYLSTIIILTAGISIIAQLWFRVPAEAFIVPLIYLVLVFTLFTVQVRRERQANVLYLKGL